MNRILLTVILITAGCSLPTNGEEAYNDINNLRLTFDVPVATKITSWNAYSRQFIDPPVFKLLVIPGTHIYTAQVRHGKHAWNVESSDPVLGLAKIWPKMDIKTFLLRFQWLDKEGKVLAQETSIRVKAPDWQGLKESNADWIAAADRNIDYLIDVACNGKAPYREPNVPVWIWSSVSPTVTDEYKNWIGTFPGGYEISYPCITFNYYIWGFLAHVQRDGMQKDEAMRLAKFCADWGLKNHLPDSGVLPAFPFSTISMGKFAGGNEGNSVNLLRASWLGVSFVDIYKATGNLAYLDYARHIADTTIKFQKEDGSFPYRINPKTGAVVEDYTCAAIEFISLVDALAPFDFDPNRSKAAQKALDWTLAYVCTTMNWKAVFEDVSPLPAYSNLSGFETQMLIRYLCRHKNEDPAYLPTARRLNRWLEDQFVVFGPESEAFVHSMKGKGLLRVKGPLVFEQYQCWLPMETHTGSWILTLIELHKATGDTIYLDKAKAAANAICALQFDNGAFATLGSRYYKDGKIVYTESGLNWYSCNAAATKGLYDLDAYLKSISGKKR